MIKTAARVLLFVLIAVAVKYLFIAYVAALIFKIS